MFEHFDPRALECVTRARVEARRLGHEEIGTVHLLLAVAGLAPQLLGVSIVAVRSSVVALEGSAPVRSSGMMALSVAAKAALEGANGEALKRGHTIIDPAHLLLSLLDSGGGATRALREAGATPGEVRERANAAAGSGSWPAQPPAGSPPSPTAPTDPAEDALAPAPPAAQSTPLDHSQALRDGAPVRVTLDTDRFPIGDLGHPRVDVRLLELMLVKDTPVARLLRDHGIDEARLRELFGPPQERR
jgi:ATP-dependent Clp protease ATP-binding subunit ClpA